MWLYEGKEFAEVPQEYVGFVYCITNLKNGRMYIGKKLFGRKVTLKRKTKRNKRTTRESNWKDYFGSSEELKADVEALGIENFKREILRLCRTKAETNYYELKEQIDRDVLLKPKEYYNSFVGTKIHRNHIITKKKKTDEVI